MLKINRPKRGRAPIKEPINQKFNIESKINITITHSIVVKRGRKKKSSERNNTINLIEILGFRDTLTKSSNFYQYLYTVRRGRQEGRKTERLPLEGREAGVN